MLKMKSRIQTFFGKADRLVFPAHSACSAAKLSCLWKGRAGKWGKSPPGWSDHHHPSVLKDDHRITEL